MDVDVPTPEPLRIRKVQSLVVPLQPVFAEPRPRPALIRHTKAVNDCENQLIHDDGLFQYSTPSTTSATIQARWESSDIPSKPVALDRKNENIKMARNGQHFFSRGSKLLSRIATSIEGIKDRNFTVGSSKSRLLNPSSSRPMTRALSGYGRENHPSSAQELLTFPNHSGVLVAERIGTTDPQQNSISTLNLRKLRSKQKQQVATALPLNYADISLNGHYLMPLTGANRLIRVAVDVAATLTSTIRRSRNLRANAALDVVVLVDTTSVFESKLVEVQADTTCGPDAVTQSTQSLLDVISAIYASLVPYYDRFSLFVIGDDENRRVQTFGHFLCDC
ncbi:hypothetical protein KEM56_002089 [Ascosphaera pollenicola]|nr:hypothetical protein KEM56_002089 [Ascosphaera pollenicola]